MKLPLLTTLKMRWKVGRALREAKRISYPSSLVVLTIPLLKHPVAEDGTVGPLQVLDMHLHVTPDVFEAVLTTVYTVEAIPALTNWFPLKTFFEAIHKQHRSGELTASSVRMLLHPEGLAELETFVPTPLPADVA